VRVVNGWLRKYQIIQKEFAVCSSSSSSSSTSSSSTSINSGCHGISCSFPQTADILGCGPSCSHPPPFPLHRPFVPNPAYHQFHKVSKPTSWFLAAHSTFLLVHFAAANCGLMRHNFMAGQSKIFSTKSRNFLANVQKSTSILQFVTYGSCLLCHTR
jgi:hypothetical protein